MVVLAVMGTIAVIGFWGLRSSNTGEILANQQKDLVSRLRNTQNKILAGSDGLATRSATFTNSATSYQVDGVTYNLGNNQLISSQAATVNVCFVNVNLTYFAPSASCPCTNAFACDGGGAALSSPVNLLILDPQSGLSKEVTIEGSGIFIGRIYGQ